MNPESPSEPTREELIALIKAQAAEIAALKARIAELERRLGLNSAGVINDTAGSILASGTHTHGSIE